MRALRQQLRSLPSQDPDDPGYRRLRYVRYADDSLLGFAGPKAEAEEIKQRLAEFLRDELKLELSQDKTLITHARSQRGAVPRLRDHRASTTTARSPGGKRSRSTARSGCACPRSVIKAKNAPRTWRAANPRAGPDC